MIFPAEVARSLAIAVNRGTNEFLNRMLRSSVNDALAPGTDGLPRTQKTGPEDPEPDTAHIALQFSRLSSLSAFKNRILAPWPQRRLECNGLLSFTSTADE